MIGRAAAFFVVVLGVVAALADAAVAVEHYAVVIGDDRGAPGEVQLRYAEADADKMAAVLRELGGVAPENLVVLRRENADDVVRALIAVNDRIRSRGGADATLYVYYSGHADAEALHLGSSRLPLEQLAQLVRGSAARFRMLVLDGCRSGALTRLKGGTRAPPFVINLDAHLASEGAVFLTASAANEDAQESDELKGSFFTHYLVSGLVGAADENGDGLVTLDEAYRYAYQNTLRASSRTLAGTQHPTFAIAVRGQGDVVLTSLRATTRWSRVELPPGRGYLLFAGSAAGPVAAELGPDDRTRALVLAPGRYFVRGRGRDFLVEGTVALAANATTRVEDAQLTRVAYARLVRKGGTAVTLVQAPLAGYRLRTSIIAGASPCHGFVAGYALTLRNVTLEPRVAGCRGTFANPYVRADTDELGLELAIAHAWDLSWLTVGIALVGGVAVLREGFTPLQGGTTPARDSVAGQLAGELELTRDLGRGLFVFASAAAAMYVFSTETTDFAHSVATTVKPAGLFAIGLGLQIE